MELFLSNPDQGEGGEAVAGGAVQQDAALPGQVAVGGQVGGREVNLFPHGCTADVEMHCVTCLKNRPRYGYKAAKDKMGKVKSQCSRCKSITCRKHYVLVRQGCTEDLKVKDADISESDYKF